LDIESRRFTGYLKGAHRVATKDFRVAINEIGTEREGEQLVLRGVPRTAITSGGAEYKFLRSIGWLP
jgi:hypothetical protein